MKSIREAELKDKRVLLRVDFNVSIKNGQIVDDYRIRSALPTIQYLIEQRARIILMTHLGKPGGKLNLDLSTIPIARRLAQLLHHPVAGTDFVVGREVDGIAAAMRPGDVLLLGNLRFNQGEEANEQSFAQSLAKMADLYINDAFAVCHRAAASVEAIAKLLPAYAGLRLESEMTELSLFLARVEHPFVILIGGVKIKDKAGVIDNLMPLVDEIIVGGGVANTFLAARGEDVGQSVYEPEMIPYCREVIEKCGSKLILPLDGIKMTKEEGVFEIRDLGPATINRYVQEIKKARAIFWNGNLGYTEDARYEQGTKQVAQAIAGQQTLNKVVAGGDTVSFINTHDLAAGFTFISTGGSAALKFLAGKQLPGIVALG